ncbi:MAG: pyridoxamine 5'-phosphate oxidase family protein [Gaiellaceae bacterium]
MIDSEDASALADIQHASYARARGIKASWPEADALDAEGIADFLGRRRYCVLATGRPDGRPHAAPVAFVLSGGALWFATVDGLRLRNLRAIPWASLVVIENEPHHVALTAEGPVTLHEGDAFSSAFEPVRETWLARHGHEPDWAEAFVELRPKRLFSHASSS